MNNDFSLEIKTLGESKNIENKLMIFSIYYDVYNALVRTLGNYQKGIANNYGGFLTKTVELCAISANLADKSIDCKAFIESYLRLLNMNMISKIEPVKEIIDYHKDNLEQFTKGMKYVPIVDSLNINFETKTKVIMVLREHINNVFCTMVRMYGEEESFDLRHGIVEVLTTSIPSMLKNGVDLDLFRKKLKEETKKIIDKKIVDKELDALAFNDELPKSFFESLDELEMKIYMLGLSYALAGYQQNDPDVEKMKVKDACQKLNMSSLKYTIKATSLAFKLIKWSIKANKTTNNTTFGMQIHKKQ